MFLRSRRGILCGYKVLKVKSREDIGSAVVKNGQLRYSNERFSGKYAFVLKQVIDG
jgi:hypothetical protein